MNPCSQLSPLATKNLVIKLIKQCNVLSEYGSKSVTSKRYDSESVPY